MKHILSLFAFVAVSFYANSQYLVKGVISDAKTSEALAFVNIVVEGAAFGTTTDLDGRFRFELPKFPKGILFSYIGYKPAILDSVQLTSQSLDDLKIRLSIDNEVLQQVDLIAKENPAHRIIRAAVANRELHKPENYPSFRYNSYNKFVLTMNPDSLTLPDTLMTPIDSTRAEMVDFLQTKHIFLMESVSERKRKSDKEDSEKVLATRISGFENPAFAMLATEFQSLSFYNDYISVLSQQYLSPLSIGSTKKYFFRLKDTLYREADSIFVIQFEPRRGTNFAGVKGALYVSTDGFAVTNVLAEPAKKEGIGVSVQQQYKKTNTGYWFPHQLNADFVFPNARINGFPPVGISRSYLKNIEVGIDFEKKEIAKVDLIIDDKAAKQSDSFWNQYREDTLSAKEKGTYVFIDSLSKAESLEKKLKLYQAVLSGVWPVGPVELDLDRLIYYNEYEGLRLGLGMHTSDKLSEHVKIGGYTAYGLKDKEWKYGADIDFTINKIWNWHFGYAFMNDVKESGKITYLSKKALFGLTDIRSIYVSGNRDRIKRHSLYNSIYLLPTLHFKQSFQVEEYTRIEDYLYLAGDWQMEQDPNTFNFTNIRAEFEFKPNERVIQTSQGRMSLNKSFPIYNLNIEQGINGLFNSQFDYTAVHFKVHYQWGIRNAGKLEARISLGKVFGEVPYSKLVTGYGNSVDKFAVSSPFSFETMGLAEFASSEYAYLNLAHDFGTLLINKKYFHPSIRIVHNMAIGSFANSNEHQIERKNLEKGYLESGIEFNKILSTIGLGVYYRYGPNALEDAKENIAVKMTVSLPF
ncbi:MAG: hypothetical protein ACI8ZO_000027 [Flavobacteriales bacterium]|jgi:hypothetical protein